MTKLTCPQCGPKWNGAYNTDHRCVTCGVRLLATTDNDDELHRLRRDNSRLRQALELLIENEDEITSYELSVARQALEGES